MAFYGYVRVSTQEQVEGGSLTAQERHVRAAGTFLGAEMMEMFSDGGVSGYTSLFERPGSKRLIDRVSHGDTVIVAKLDRMFRSVTEALEWLEYFKAHGVKLILCDMGLDPVTENGVSKMLFTILAAMAEFERNRLKERSAEGRAEKKASGGHIGGKPPFGFMIEGSGKSARCVPDPALTDALSDLKRCFDAGTSLRGASQYLSGKGVRVSFNQVHRVYQKFEYDRTEEAERRVADSASAYVRRKE